MGGFNNDLIEGFISNSRIWIIIKPGELLELEVRQHGVPWKGGRVAIDAPCCHSFILSSRLLSGYWFSLSNHH